MNKSRVEAFTDGVVAIAITIMVLALKVPTGPHWTEVLEMAPVLCAYLLSFVYVGIYWVNHHHVLQLARQVNGRILWTNLHLLFWLSLVPLVTAWAGNYPLIAAPMALYGVVLLMCAIAFRMLVRSLVDNEGPDSPLAQALGHSRKKEWSIALYIAAIALSLWHAPAGAAIYVAVAILWLIPQRRKETPQ
ncbi:TMEM175 family protein [Janthinobacterium sp. PC23-8]|uniref:TMEM175 family protein n=1 Tax=Janthinobacterium sp. PC23-8 TaxID=2012679 RepID=UPI000B965F51|nr:TMEM175 family protein [Janthinobacterium sp. PC23-8]OYO28179.1 hypothetical protein CD932_23570 [Janthinobacterium sp. PC23-8]